VNFSKAPRFNHVALSLPGHALDDAGRAAICEFYEDVFGFEEYEDLTRDRERLVLRAHHHEQFVSLIADDPPMTAPRMDHWGMSVSTKDDFDECARRATAWAERAPDEVDLIAPHFDQHGDFLKLHSFYVRYRLPIMVEVQFFEWLS
jgi:hypothetical protein